MTVPRAEGVLDFAHDRLISNPDVPRWWPAFCLAYDVAAAAHRAWLIKSGRIRARSSWHTQEFIPSW